MYRSSFGLTEHPFELRSDPRFLYLSPSHARARAYLQYALLKRDSIVVVTGDIGSGKSTLVDDLVHASDPECTLLVLHQTQLDELELLRSVLLALRVDAPDEGKARTLAAIRSALVSLWEQGRRAVLVVDDAQNLSAVAIEELRMLADDEHSGERLLSLILVGQPNLQDTLDAPALMQVRQRVRLRDHLRSLSLSDTRGYIEHRLRIAGHANGELFRTDAVRLIWRATDGVPRLINILCDMALTAAAQKFASQVSRHLVFQAIEELGWPEPAPEKTWSGLRGRHLFGAAPTFVQGRHWLNRFAGLRRGRALLDKARSWVSTAGYALTRVWGVVNRSVDRGVLAAKSLGRGVTAEARRAAVTRRVPVSAVVGVTVSGLALILLLAAPGPSNSATALMMEGPIGSEAEDLILTALPKSAPAVPRSFVDAGEVREVEAVSATPDAQVPLIATALPQARALETLPSGRPVHDRQWLLAQPPHTYTIQIMGTHSTRNLNRFLRRQDISDTLARFTVQRHERDWTVLVNGVYPDFASARRAAASLPASLRATQPWVRRMAEIHNAIRDSSVPAPDTQLASAGESLVVPVADFPPNTAKR